MRPDRCTSRDVSTVALLAEMSRKRRRNRGAMS